jgi:hypothetical protein|tara:strand:+ start:3574 stop:3903 length:330 start_codon:yes stop_codon:yes gene_type:complete
MTPVSDAMAQGVQDATGDFVTTLIQMLESKGIDLDTLMQDSVEDQTDVVGPEANPMEFLNEEELMILVQKFEALDPQVQQQLEQAVTEQLGPEVIRRLKAVQRFAHGRR